MDMSAKMIFSRVASILPALLSAAIQAAPLADVKSVRVSSAANAYQFSVEVASPDRGCDQYADWWEILLADGTLVYRRILAHSHVDEQPFSRSGGPVKIGPDSVVWVRAHMHPGGYGGQAMKGTVKAGFNVAAIGPGFAADVARQAPQPEGVIR